MLKSSFIIIPGIGEITEKKLWRQGIFSWDDFEERFNGIKLDTVKRDSISKYLAEANRALENHDGEFFAQRLRQKDYWRLASEFWDEILYLDIETTGLSLYYDDITLIGTFDGSKASFFVRDNNLEAFPDYVRRFKVMVTFNGKLFDIPFIQKQFSGIELPSIHIDLRYILRSLGLTGPLKRIEEQLDLERPEELKEINGRGAVVLWSRFLKGDNEALRTLLSYNTCDTANLRSILAYCYRKKEEIAAVEMEEASYQLELTETQRRTRTRTVLPSLGSWKPKIHAQSKKDGLVKIHSKHMVPLTVDRRVIERTDIRLNDLLKEVSARGYATVVVGVDLSGSESKPSGICILSGKEAYLDMIRTDEEIVNKVAEVHPAVVSIDSPLGLPKGRCCASDSCECRVHGITRECERTLKSRGVNVYPCLIPSMQSLTTRGIELAKMLQNQGFNVIESYPGVAQDVLVLPRKRVDLNQLELDLINTGIRLSLGTKTSNHDEVDALTSALVGYFFLAGRYEALGNAEEGLLIVPKPA